MQPVIAAAGRRVGLLLVSLVLLLWYGLAAASPARARRVAVVDAPVAFVDALRVALSSWGLEVVPLDGPVPTPQVAAAARTAEGLVGERDVGLVLWVDAGQGDGPAWLWIYDADTGQLAQRPLPAGPPTTAEPAAAAALTAKTMIRLSVVAPASERFGARPAWRPRVRLEAGAEVRALVAGPTDERLITQSVTASVVVVGGLTVAARVSAGPGFAIDDTRLVARFTRTSVAALARFRVAEGSWWAIEPGTALGVHFTSLDGSVPGADAPVAEARTNLSVGATTSLVLRVGGGLELAATIGIDVPLTRQRYLLGGEAILELPSVEPVVGVQVRVPID